MTEETATAETAAPAKPRNQLNHKIPIEGPGYEATISVKATTPETLEKAIAEVNHRLDALKQLHGIA